MVSTISATGTEVLTSLGILLAEVNRVLVEDERLLSNDLSVYYGTAQAWLAAPPAIIAADGVLVQAADYTIDQTAGSVTFDTPRMGTEVITATYWFTPFTATAISDLALTAVYALEMYTGQGFDETQLPRSFQPFIVRIAFATALRALMAGRLDHYKYVTGGQTVDKSGIATRYRSAVAQEEAWIRDNIPLLQMQHLAGGSSVDMLFDMGQRPTPYSRYVPIYVPVLGSR